MAAWCFQGRWKKYFIVCLYFWFVLLFCKLLQGNLGKLVSVIERDPGCSMKTLCRNPSFGLVTKAKGLQGCGPRGSPRVKAKRSQRCGLRGSPRVTSHTPGNVRKCEGMWGSEDSHSQGNSHFGRWSPDGLSKL